MRKACGTQSLLPECLEAHTLICNLNINLSFLVIFTVFLSCRQRHDLSMICEKLGFD